MDISGVDLSAIRASTMSAGAGAFPPEHEQSFVGGDLLSLISPELHRRAYWMTWENPPAGTTGTNISSNFRYVNRPLPIMSSTRTLPSGSVPRRGLVDQHDCNLPRTQLGSISKQYRRSWKLHRKQAPGSTGEGRHPSPIRRLNVRSRHSIFRHPHCAHSRSYSNIIMRTLPSRSVPSHSLSGLHCQNPEGDQLSPPPPPRTVS